MEALERKTARDKDRTQKKQEMRDRKSVWLGKLNVVLEQTESHIYDSCVENLESKVLHKTKGIGLHFCSFKKCITSYRTLWICSL